MMLEAIILCGGMGTRLKEITGDLPKPMVEIGGRPFLDYMLRMLAKSGFEHVVLAVGYRSDVIRDYFGESRYGILIDFAFEDEPLGTGGGIRNALTLCEQDRIFILNGDTLAMVPFQEVMEHHRSDITICGKWMDDCGRYGILEVDSGMRITAFREKESNRSGYINTGVYLVDREVIACDRKHFSFEKDFLEVKTHELDMRMFSFTGFFIDIGVPDDCRRALEILPEQFKEYF